MEFKEFLSPEEEDYDINISLKGEDENSKSNYQKKNSNNLVKDAFDRLLCDLGFPEIYELEEYGITEEEYDSPTMDTLNKLRNYASDMEKSSVKRR